MRTYLKNSYPIKFWINHLNYIASKSSIDDYVIFTNLLSCFIFNKTRFEPFSYPIVRITKRIRDEI